MSSSVPISASGITAPTPQNTPAQHAPISSGLSRPTVPDISEEGEAAEELTSLGAAGVQSAMLGMVHGKLAGLVGRSSGYIEPLPMAMKRSVEGLKGVQVQLMEPQNQYKRECLELERKVCVLFLWGEGFVPRASWSRDGAIDDGNAHCHPPLTMLPTYVLTSFHTISPTRWWHLHHIEGTTTY
ncbi:hypothetical protein B0H13DRAFT_2457665 [Mycena leptocephala]|nr:hypothetical protein B0H13DRAFT_2457665 [Mycena leptocephala]